MRILVINPNSLEDCTASIDEAMGDLRKQTGAQIDCVTLQEGPPGIETQEHIESVVFPVARRIESDPADGYVIACFSDPGLYLARSKVARPIVGCGEAGFRLATALGQRFGVIAMRDRSIPRHIRYITSLGFADRLAADRAINQSVASLADRSSVIDKIVACGERLRDEDGADVLVLGCSNMGRYRTELEDRLKIPVVDPSQAGAAAVIGMAALGYARAS